MPTERSAEETSTSASTDRGLSYTAYECNAWSATFKKTGVRVLVDPWLVDDLVFVGQKWLYRGSKRDFQPSAEEARRIGDEADFILLTMSIDDHTHKPTLEVLSKDIPVVGSPSACKVAKSLGFKHVQQVDHGEKVTVADGRLSITGTKGALVGPPWSKRENGWVFEEQTPGGLRVYYEPHCDYDHASVAAVGKVDVVITPPATQAVLGYALVKGNEESVKLLELLQPSVAIALNNAEFIGRGLLDKILTETGSAEDLKRKMAEKGLSTTLQAPAPPGQPLDVSV